MQRLTISLDDDIAESFDKLIEQRGYVNRSEAFRDLIRREIAHECISRQAGNCVAVVSYSFDHHKLQLNDRLTELQHSHSSLVISSMHVHINHCDCVEAVVLKGPTQAVEKFAHLTIAERGIENGHVHIIPIDSASHDHKHHQTDDDHHHDPL